MTEPFTTVFALYPGTTQLDFTAPWEVLSRLPDARTALASLTGGSLGLGPGFELMGLVALPTIERCDLLCVPGGYGTADMLLERRYLAELERLGKRATYVMSICTGSLLLAAAGLLHGKRAACHWAWRDLLAQFDVTVDTKRVVRDGNVFTGGGVTAGIDLALAVVAHVAGRDVAEAIQLGIEYAPEPPFDAGRPESARPEVLARVIHRLEALGAPRRDAVNAAVAYLRTRDAEP